MSAIASQESSDPLVSDSDAVRSMRGLLYVHIYSAFEFAMDQAFIRFAQYLSSQGIKGRHLETPIFSVALDSKFQALQELRDPTKKFRKRIETMQTARDTSHVTIPDTVLSPCMQSAGTDAITLAFEVYGLPQPYFAELSHRGYIDEVVERRHAVAHGRESPVAVGVRKISEMRIRTDALYRQAVFVIDTINRSCADLRFVLPRFRREYR